MNNMNITNRELNIKSIISVVKKNWSKAEIQKSRNQEINRVADLLVCIMEGYATYELNGKSQLLRAGDIVYLSRGCKYSRHILSDYYYTVFIDFNFDVPQDCVLPCTSFEAISGIDISFIKLYKTWTAHGASYRSDCMSIFYGIYASLIRSATFSYIPKSKREFFEAAIKTISENYVSEELSVSTLAAQSEMSEVHFRRLFKKIYSVAPQQYIMSLRITHAQELLKYNNGSIDEIARTSGFPDPCYFSRIFKQKTGYTPSEYRETFCTFNLG